MSYYKGDYYRGDYYRGDLFGFLKKAGRAVVKTVGGAALGFAGGGPKGAITGAIGGAASATRANIREATLEAGDRGSAYTPALREKHRQALLRGGAGGGTPKPATSITAPGGGGRGRTRTLVPIGVGADGSIIMGSKRRRMNWANPRALVRAERRIGMFVDHARKYLRWVEPKKQGTIVPAFKRRKKK